MGADLPHNQQGELLIYTFLDSCHFCRWTLIRILSTKLVSVLFIELIPFLRCTRDAAHLLSRVVSMPFLGLIPFLLPETPVAPETPVVCQCPLSGSSHFYSRINNHPFSSLDVSMPFIGLIPFLHIEWI